MIGLALYVHAHTDFIARMQAARPQIETVLRDGETTEVERKYDQEGEVVGEREIIRMSRVDIDRWQAGTVENKKKSDFWWHLMHKGAALTWIVVAIIAGRSGLELPWAIAIGGFCAAAIFYYSSRLRRTANNREASKRLSILLPYGKGTIDPFTVGLPNDTHTMHSRYLILPRE